MSDSTTMGLPQAAHHLGVPVRTLRRAIRAGRLPAPAGLTATSALPAGWLEQAQATIEASPKTLVATVHQRVPPFARYEGTSAWRKYRNRVREYSQSNAKVD